VTCPFIGRFPTARARSAAARDSSAASGSRAGARADDRELLEARKRLGGAVGVEPLDAGQEAIGSEDPEPSRGERGRTVPALLPPSAPSPRCGCARGHRGGGRRSARTTARRRRPGGRPRRPHRGGITRSHRPPSARVALSPKPRYRTSRRLSRSPIWSGDRVPASRRALRVARAETSRPGPSINRRAASASRRSCSDVDPMRSVKTIVTTLRAPASSVGCATRETPQASQNCPPGSHSWPHAGQRGARILPQPLQNREPARLIFPQLGQVMATHFL
jgi:hypothetical protein